MSGFPQQVQTFPAPAVAGDFATANPRFATIAGPGALVAGQALTVGRFAWCDPAFIVANSNGSGPVAGFLGRNQQGLITVYLSESSNQVVPGTQCFLYSGGDFWVVNDGTSVPIIGVFKAYANYATGKVTFAATGAPPQAASVTGSIAAGAGSVTASIAAVYNNEQQLTGVMTVSAVGSGTIQVGGLLSGTGVQTGTRVVNQLTGTANGIGTYTVSVPQTTASTTITESHGIMTVTAVASGALNVGDVLAGANVTANTVLTAFGTGLGGTGTYVVDTTQTAASATITATGAVETKWYAMSQGQPGELVKISDHPLG